MTHPPIDAIRPADPQLSIGVLGTNGFIGSAVWNHLVATGHKVTALPRVDTAGISSVATQRLNAEERKLLKERAAAVAVTLEGFDSVINCAGAATPDDTHASVMWEPNSLLPRVVAEAMTHTSGNFIHVSSAAVQGTRLVLDESTYHDPHSAYAKSKATAEAWLLESELAKTGRLVIYRPTSVLAPGTAKLERIARVAARWYTPQVGRGAATLPLVTLDNVARAIGLLATASPPLPLIALHPFEGITQADLLLSTGHKRGLVVPAQVARVALGALRRASSVLPRIRGRVRRLDLYAQGQAQQCSALEKLGYVPAKSTDVISLLTHAQQVSPATT